MQHLPFPIGAKVKCISPIGELIQDRIYTVRADTNISFMYLKESTSKYHNYLPSRFKLFTPRELTFDEQVAVAKNLIGKIVEYNHTKIEVTDVIVFIKGIHSDKISGIVQDVLETKDWCIGLRNGGQTIPFQSITFPSYIEVEKVADYQAKVYKDHVMVGCQKISKEKFDEIAKAFKDLA